ncbi:MAG TPA: ABC transporter ATP-binding protein [Planctomycetaceae bacterium]|nr:ABC transporter ATP-binding protein [Planctomycetaceae bacterium]
MDAVAPIRTEGLTKRYGSLCALDACSLTVERGEAFGLLGPNGAGKTTLLRLLLGFLQPTEGRAFVESYDCQRQSLEVRRHVSYLPGDPRLFRHMTGRQVLRFFASVRPGGDVARLQRVAERLELDLSRRVASMSTGMRQKLALAATLGADTPIVILDEPTSNLDPTVRREVMRLVVEARDEGRTVLFSSHVLAEVEQTCDRVGILRRGRLEWLQVLSELKRLHRIQLRLESPAGASGELKIPPELAEHISVRSHQDGRFQLETHTELARVLRWLASLPLAEVQIEPVGLQAIYDKLHPPEQRDA